MTITAATTAPKRSTAGVGFSVASAMLTVLHSAYELAGGVGLPGQKVFGLPGAVGAHGLLLGGWLGAARRGSSRAKRAVALLNGLGLAGAAMHYVAWPAGWRGLPLVVDGAEGLSGRWARGYNAVLYPWAVAAAVAVRRETRAEDRRWVVVGLGSMPLVAAASHRKVEWVRHQAALRPRWWNRALQ